MLPKHITRSVTKKYGIVIENVNSQPNPTQKRRSNRSNNTPPGKRVKIESTEEPPTVINFIDINDHCLEHILSYLELGDLLNIAQTSNSLLTVARTAYARKYGKKSVSVRTARTLNHEPKFQIDEKRIRINSFSNRLKILRCFGGLISKLEIQYWGTSRDQQVALDDYISKYCAASVINIDGNSSGATMPNFSKCIPNVQCLELRECNTAYITHTAAHLSLLEHLTIWNEYPHRDRIPTNVIHSNPQLKSLKLHWNVDLNLLRTCSEHLEELESLEFVIESWNDSQTTNSMLRFKNVKKLQFGFFCLSEMPNISMSFEKLEEFTFVTPHPYFDDIKGLIGFISKHPQITKFRYPSRDGSSQHPRLNPLFAKQIAKLLPSLEEFDLRGICFEVDDAVDLLKLCPQLKNHQFKLSGEYNVLLQRLGEEWSSSVDQDGIVKMEYKNGKSLSIASKN